MYGRLLARQRCLAVTTGYFEWKLEGTGSKKTKTPYYVHMADGSPMVMAALFDICTNEQGEARYTYSVLTCSPSSSIAWLHDRMPVILDETQWDTWLDTSRHSVAESLALLRPYSGALAWHRVAASMGNIRTQGPQCTAPVSATPQANCLTQWMSSAHATSDEAPMDGSCTQPQKSSGESNPSYTSSSTTSAAHPSAGHLTPPAFSSSSGHPITKSPPPKGSTALSRWLVASPNPVVSTPSTPAPTPSSFLPVSDIEEDAISALVEMGFDRDRSIAALASAQGDLERAVQIALGNNPDVFAGVQSVNSQQQRKGLEGDLLGREEGVGKSRSNDVAAGKRKRSSPKKKTPKDGSFASSPTRKRAKTSASRKK
eukprot:gnl/Spiro4/16022_TR8614_c0_g1_i1.p1 gnl/Spiro4/16022_TR8614_c0_g1~~gnl/Spiro4/16022_TR8614_c0_g1_i1.p1  ORF type:complete len:426 (+),score=53.39 gnl/Spiro4/16022_TR8614_c0_g1_i1:166-1278(+)